MLYNTCCFMKIKLSGVTSFYKRNNDLVFVVTILALFVTILAFAILAFFAVYRFITEVVFDYVIIIHNAINNFLVLVFNIFRCLMFYYVIYRLIKWYLSS